MMRVLSNIVLCSILILLTAGCRIDSDNDSSNADAHNSHTPDLNAPLADYELLFMGNSHSSQNELPQLVATLLTNDGEGKSANAFNAPGWSFLDGRLNDGVSYGFMQSREWTHVILQAQKYSTTGRYSYPTDAAKTWIQRAKQQNAIPIMFPEWPRRGNFEEGQRIHMLHMSIVLQEPACVAPIGLAWDAAIALRPTINLHASDGNHSNPTGALLSAYVFYGVISNKPVSDLEYLPSLPANQSMQTFLRQVAADTLAAHPPCQYFQSPKLGF
ncbi:hypothetical protein [Pleionea litopenaei]|uniref:Lipoprotein n=1 Tax=Pleionea litopenaei TaxID=3070815 RepID=A0AA51X672_9GAMM|nr:hypothetical protein [Pleionea sp. HL-JVS1]WMS86813.1 hypothetical protein Q9312_16455 [Pleionea sp. HL-JVS1]